MMKLNKVITLSLSLALVPALSFSSSFTDNAARYGRAAAFHASRFVAGRLVVKAMNYVAASDRTERLFDVLGAPMGLNGSIRYDINLLGRSASAAMGPKAFNKITVNAKNPMLKFLAPQSGLADGSGRIAYWAGMASSNLLSQLSGKSKLLRFLKYLV